MDELHRGLALRKLHYGIKVERPASLLPQGGPGQFAIFNIVGGRVALIQLIGEVTVIIAGAASNTSMIGTPAVGTATLLCAVLATTADEVGCLYGITGLPADALIGADAGALPGQERDVVLPVGTLDWISSVNNTGEVRWTLYYIPIDDGAHVTVA